VRHAERDGGAAREGEGQRQLGGGADYRYCAANRFQEADEMQTSGPAPTEIIHVKTHAVSCDGGEGVYGHPKVYLRIVDKQIMCPYCSRLFVLAAGAVDTGH